MWEKLNLHLEHLLPGMLTLFLVYLLGAHFCLLDSLTEDIAPIIGSEFVKVGLLVSASYVVGVIVSAVSRAILDFLSAIIVRPLFLWIAIGRQPERLNGIYRKFLVNVLKGQNQAILDEVLKRRESGRLLRGCLIPALLGWIYFIAAAPFSTSDARYEWWRWGSATIFVGILCLYASCEMSIFHEARLHEENTKAIAPDHPGLFSRLGSWIRAKFKRKR